MHLQCDDISDATLSASSFIEGDSSLKSPFLVTLPRKTLDEDSPHHINVVNATCTLSVAQLITGQGKRDFMPIVDLLCEDLRSYHSQNSSLSALGSSAHSEYLLKTLCLYSMKIDKDFSEGNEKHINNISRILEQQAFVANSTSSKVQRATVLDAMRLARCSGTI